MRCHDRHDVPPVLDHALHDLPGRSISDVRVITGRVPSLSNDSRGGRRRDRLPKIVDHECRRQELVEAAWRVINRVGIDTHHDPRDRHRVRVLDRHARPLLPRPRTTSCARRWSGPTTRSGERLDRIPPRRHVITLLRHAVSAGAPPRRPPGVRAHARRQLLGPRPQPTVAAGAAAPRPRRLAPARARRWSRRPRRPRRDRRHALGGRHHRRPCGVRRRARAAGSRLSRAVSTSASMLLLDAQLVALGAPRRVPRPPGLSARRDRDTSPWTVRDTEFGRVGWR